ncbi:MAG TPA: carboxypeptidase regulatory-like domain-containing protein [Solirubrobacteraceae bacterium]|nr:carboxypeptidase regulatory-like domain-containing protein [Solirubrobacteraceae bacterium]
MRRVTEVFRAPQAPDEQREPHAPAGAGAGPPHRGARVRILGALGAVALVAVLLPATAAAIPPTAISGKVTNAKTKAGIDGARVCATLESGGTPKCAEASASGEYEIAGLVEGEYEVDFTGEVCFGGFCETEYVSKTATEVEVETGKTTTVNAELTELERGRISGRVTSGGSPLSGIEACADVYFECATTNSNGEYTITGLSQGSYIVYFRPKEECKADICQLAANYIPQYYNGQLMEESANSVKVEAGKTASGINAEMQVGGQISGKVTNAANSQAIANLEVCSLTTAANKEGEREFGEECTLTNSSGEYTIHALSTQGYEVDFTGYVCTESNGKSKCTHPWVTQYYPGIVSVTAPNTTSGINGSLLEVTTSKPGSTAAPAVTGSTTVGSVLSCSQGSWNNNPVSYTYKWLRNGSAIEGQTATTYTVQSADLGTGISCEVTASNAAGSTGATSNTLAIPKPAPGVAVVTAVHIKGATLTVTLRCTGASACKGSIKLLTYVLSGRGKHKHRRSTAIGTTVGFTISLGASATLRLHLTGQGLRLLSHAGRKGLQVQITGTGVTVRKYVLKKK